MYWFNKVLKKITKKIQPNSKYETFRLFVCAKIFGKLTTICLIAICLIIGFFIDKTILLSKEIIVSISELFL